MLFNRNHFKKIYVEADSISYSKMSGIGHATLELIKALSELTESHNLKISIIVPRSRLEIVNGHGLKNVRVIALPLYKYFNYLLVRTPLPIPVDLLLGRGTYIFPNYKTWYVPLSKSVMFAHDVVFKIFPQAVSPKNLTYMKKNFERWLKRSDKIVTISQASAADFKQYFPSYKSKLSVIYLGVDEDVFYPRPASEVERVRAKYNLPVSYFLYVGNIEPRKNIMAMLNAYEKYSQDNQEALPLILFGGDGWNNESIIDKIDKLNTAGFNVMRSSKYLADADLPAVYTGAIGLIHVALHEGFGLAPAQAIACGTAIIASDIPALREILSKEVIFVDPKNINGIAEAFKKVESGTQTKPYIFHTWRQTAKALLELTVKIK